LERKIEIIRYFLKPGGKCGWIGGEGVMRTELIVRVGSARISWSRDHKNGKKICGRKSLSETQGSFSSSLDVLDVNCQSTPPGEGGEGG